MNASARWKNRRRMAWASLVAGLAYPLLLWVTDSDQIGSVAGPFYVFVTGVVASYIGWATWDDVKHDESESSLGNDRPSWPSAPGER
jgi:hypothetical protein